jgi:competence protein ComEC
LRRFVDAVREEALAQTGAAFLWLVAAFALGVGVFFAWPTDPWPWAGMAVSALAVVGLLIRRRLDAMAGIALAVLAFGLGLTAAQIRVNAVGAPVITRETNPIDITGRVYEVQREPGRVRVILDGVKVEEIAGPLRVRLSVPAKHGAPRVGDEIALRAVLRPPERPVIPGGFEYQRYLFFDGIGALGYTLQPWRLLSTEESPVRGRIENLRRDIADRILAVVPGDVGAVAVALVTGEQSLISEKVQEDYRVSGLAHLLSISGLHMTLLAAAVFLLVRRSFALWPYVALRVDLKKLAAWAALAATSFYVLISGMSVPAIRAFIMVAVVILAILVDRRAISLRSIGWAALALLAVYPEALVGASFQMSFMAVIALVALYEQVSLRPIWRGADGELNIGKAVLVYVAALVVTDLVAGSVTSVFAAYHFNRMPTYSMAANLFATPITGVWIMPLALIALALMPLGFDAFAWSLMGEGVAAINGLANAVAEWPGAQVQVPPMTTWALVGAALGLLVLCLWRGRLRWLGAVPVVFAMTQPWLVAKPDVIVDESGRVLAVSDETGQMTLNPDRRDRFVRSVITERYGKSGRAWGADDLKCDAQGCVLNRNKTTLSLALSPDALADDCGRSRIIVAPQAFVDECPGSFVIDRGNLFREGAHALYMNAGRVHVVTVEDVTGNRIWSRQPPGRRRDAATQRVEDAADQ